MKPIVVFLFLLFSLTLQAQENIGHTDLNQILELSLNSFEQRITHDELEIDTTYYLHFQVINISNDTLTFITNSCFYYNHSTLTIDSSNFDFNAEGNCHFNSWKFFELEPNDSMTENQFVWAHNAYKIKNSAQEATLTFQIVQDDPLTYRIDGRNFIENAQQLVFEGKFTLHKTEITKF